MNKTKHFICLFSILISIAGCSLVAPVPYSNPYNVLEGQLIATQPVYTLSLDDGRTDLRSPANKFVLSFIPIEKDKPLPFRLVKAEYQFYSETWRSLEVTNMSRSKTVLIPREKLATQKSSEKRTERIGELLHGRYKVKISYEVSGREYEAQFEAMYKRKMQTGVVGPWTWKNWGVH
jgi:hypothetical protein